MSTSYEIDFEITGIKGRNRSRIRKAIEKMWPLSSFEVWGQTNINATGVNNLSGVYDLEDFLQKIFKKITSANGGMCSVNNTVRYIEQTPYEEFSFGPPDHEEELEDDLQDSL